jgi:uncharacterized protein YuzE
MVLRTEIDKKADAAYIHFSDEEVAYTKKLDDMRYIDYTSDDIPVGVELLSVSDGVITDDLPNRLEVEQALEDKGIKVYA